jgi:hypothetical protein
MLVKKKVRKQVEVIQEVVCNRCKGPCLIGGEMYGLSAVVSGGYESIHLDDMVTYSFELCEKCLSALFAEFQIQPDKKGLYLFAEELPGS